MHCFGDCVFSSFAQALMADRRFNPIFTVFDNQLQKRIRVFESLSARTMQFSWLTWKMERVQ
jgi:hypothetical protein